MNTWLLVLIFHYGNAGGLTSQKMGSQEKCMKAGAEYVQKVGENGWNRASKFICIEIK